ncbi:hypothetical protein HDV63DRAFT_403586 [Trichoderma sp. SZMC 28014]
MTGLSSLPRYSADDFDTASVHSAAPSYEVPSYRSRTTHSEALPSYAAAVAETTSRREASRAERSLPGRQTIGLPPLPPLASPSALNTHNYRIPTWSANNAPAARHYRNVAERRATDSWLQAAAAELLLIGMRDSVTNRQNDSREEPLRPLEDPYLVGEQAAAEARRRRIASEVNESMLREEDKQWDWMMAQMKTREERDRPSTRVRQETAQNRQRTVFGRIGERLPR